MPSSLEHFLTGEELSPTQSLHVLQQALMLKKTRQHCRYKTALTGQSLALMFDKPSLRTRFSFAIAMRELGGDIIESIGSTRKSETPADQARVLSGYCHAVMVRTFHDSDLQQMGQAASIPIINGLSDLHHPCQIFADLMTLLERFGELKGLTLSYIGDGNNILHSLLLLAPRLGVNIQYCCPAGRGPNAKILAQSIAQAEQAIIQAFTKPQQAVANAHAVYTDVWSSMGFEAQAADHLFAGFQVNEALMQCAGVDAVFMHCLPMERGKEVSETLPDQACSVIFQQSENRLHVQKALLLKYLS
ncbi:MAG TPA: ornithine carbamoyltransferase [Gammaproteobacteria bacterium]|jgi:ornithine carbamoyltransferase|nr:ornithine carbamoyltransferase [Gammaproteobacteria bacterium]